MASTKSTTKIACIAEDWLEEDKLMLLRCWRRDGYTYQDCANRIGISYSTMKSWMYKYPEIAEAMRSGAEIIDYKVENALLKSALGYKTKEVKVTTTLRHGKVVETIREVTDKEQAPNVQAIQVWLYNRLPQKWKRNRDSILDFDEEDSKIQVTITREGSKENQNQNNEHTSTSGSIKTSEEDKEWQDEINNQVIIKPATKEEREKAKKEKERQKRLEKRKKEEEMTTKKEEDEIDLDYWPEDWVDEEGD